MPIEITDPQQKKESSVIPPNLIDVLRKQDYQTMLDLLLRLFGVRRQENNPTRPAEYPKTIET